jgi:hypothetical protein
MQAIVLLEEKRSFVTYNADGTVAATRSYSGQDLAEASKAGHIVLHVIGGQHTIAAMQMLAQTDVRYAKHLVTVYAFQKDPEGYSPEVLQNISLLSATHNSAQQQKVRSPFVPLTPSLLLRVNPFSPQPIQPLTVAEIMGVARNCFLQELYSAQDAEKKSRTRLEQFCERSESGTLPDVVEKRSAAHVSMETKIRKLYAQQDVAAKRAIEFVCVGRDEFQLRRILLEHYGLSAPLSQLKAVATNHHTLLDRCKAMEDLLMGKTVPAQVEKRLVRETLKKYWAWHVPSAVDELCDELSEDKVLDLLKIFEEFPPWHGIMEQHPQATPPASFGDTWDRYMYRGERTKDFPYDENIIKYVVCF